MSAGSFTRNLHILEKGPQARFLVSKLGRFGQPDSIVPEIANPQDLNRFAYVRNSPLNYVDATGNCPEPRTNFEGTVICIDLFIKSETILFGTGEGDGRSHDTNSDPSESRAYVNIYISANGDLESTEIHLTESCTIIGCFGPYYEHTTVEVKQSADGKITVSYSVLNGFSSHLVEAGEETMYFGPFISLLGYLSIPAIDGSLTFEQNANGTWSLEELDTDPYPSIGIYGYQADGSVDILYEDSEVDTPDGPISGLVPIAANRTYYNRQLNDSSNPKIMSL